MDGMDQNLLDSVINPNKVGTPNIKKQIDPMMYKNQVLVNNKHESSSKNQEINYKTDLLQLRHTEKKSDLPQSRHAELKDQDYDQMFVDFQGSQVIRLDKTIPKYEQNNAENLEDYAQ